MKQLHVSSKASPSLTNGKIGRAALEVFFNISKKWNLNNGQQMCILGDIPKTTFYLWKKKIENKTEVILTKDTLERISYVMGIFKALNILLPTEESANRWIHQPNSAPLFNNHTALDKMLQGNVADLADIRRFLDAYRGY
jgi:hypothetical protein